MRIGLNLLYLVPGDVGGVETFGRELLSALMRAAEPGVQYIVFASLDACDLKSLERSDQFRVILCPFRARNRFVRYLWEQCLLPILVVREKVDLLHSLSYTGPIVCTVPTILTIHDANSRMVAETMTWVRRRMLWLISKRAALCARLVTTVSRFSQAEIERWYGLRESRVRVILSGPGKSSDSGHVGDESRITPGPYICAIGGSWTHKNVARLHQAFRMAAARIGCKLVLAGKVPQAVLDEIEGQPSDDVIITGYLRDDRLRAIVRGADLFVMPSLYEGFGFPVLEAQAAGVPVACSRRGALPEITAESARLFDPEDVVDIASALIDCVLDRDLNQKMRLLSLENAAKYSWDRSAAEYLERYRGVVARG